MGPGDGLGVKGFVGGRFVRLAPHLGLVNGGGPGVEVGEGVLFRGRIMSLGSNTLSLSYQRDLRRQLAHGAGAKERNLAQKYKSRAAGVQHPC